MPYSGISDPALPEYVSRLSKARRERWVAVFNEVMSRGDGEERAFAVANSLLHKALAAQLAGSITNEELDDIHELAHALAPFGKAVDQALDLGALHHAVVLEFRDRGIEHSSLHSIHAMAEGNPPYRTEVAKTAEERRYTFGVVYKSDDGSADAHNEYALADDLQTAQWDYVRSGNRSIYLQHGVLPRVGMEKAGEWVDIVTWPYPVTTMLKAAGGDPQERTIPANSVWMGTVWESWAWELVKAGRIRGYSFGGLARRERANR